MLIIGSEAKLMQGQTVSKTRGAQCLRENKRFDQTLRLSAHPDSTLLGDCNQKGKIGSTETQCVSVNTVMQGSAGAVSKCTGVC